MSSIFTTARSLAGSAPINLPLDDAAIRQLDLDLRRVVDDVIVGQDVAVVGDDHARAETALQLAAASAGRARPRWPNRSPNGEPSGNCGSCVICGVALRFDANRHHRGGHFRDDIGETRRDATRDPEPTDAAVTGAEWPPRPSSAPPAWRSRRRPRRGRGRGPTLRLRSAVSELRRAKPLQESERDITRSSMSIQTPEEPFRSVTASITHERFDKVRQVRSTEAGESRRSSPCRACSSPETVPPCAST